MARQLYSAKPSGGTRARSRPGQVYPDTAIPKDVSYRCTSAQGALFLVFFEGFGLSGLRV